MPSLCPGADEPPSGSPPPDLSEVDLLLRLARRWRRLGDTAADSRDGLGLQPHQQRALLALARLAPASGIRPSRLADHLGIAPRSTTEVADALEEAELLTRTPDPTDRRAVLLTLSDRGRQAVRAVREARRQAATHALAALSPGDRAELRRLLTTLLEEPGA